VAAGGESLGLSLAAVLGHQLGPLDELPGGAPQQQGGDGYADEFLSHIEHDAEGAGQSQSFLIEGGGHDEGGGAAAGKDGGAGQSHLGAHGGDTHQDDDQHRAAHAQEGGDHHTPLLFEFLEVDGGAQGHDEQSRDHVAEAGDLCVPNDGVGEQSAPEAGQQQDGHTENRGENGLCLLGDEFARGVNTQ